MTSEPASEPEIQIEPPHDPSRVDGYEQIRSDALKDYSSYGKVRCPALGNEFVHFVSEGFNHLVYKRAKKPRDERVQVMRFRLLPKAKTLVEVSSTFQEYEEDYEYVMVNRHGKHVKENVLIKSWGFIGIIKKFRIKVVVQQIGNGQKQFYSVVPAWITRYYKGIKLIETSRGGLTNDDEEEELKNATQGGAL